MRSYLLFAACVGFVGLILCIVRATPLELSDLSSRDLLEPSVTCIGNRNATYGILLVGESWAVGNRFLDDMRNAVLARLPGRRIEICTVGFAGRNSRRLYDEIPAYLATVKMATLFNGRTPDNIILLNGVNDAVLHIGAAHYADYTNDIVGYLRSYTQHVQVVEIPRIKEIKREPGNVFSTLKLMLFRCLYDACTYDVIDKYRSALHTTYPAISVIPYDDFIKTYVGNEDKYMADGTHLTDQYYHKYGTYLGRVMHLQ